MKKIYTLSFLLISLFVNAQVPNGSFETWSTPPAGGDDAPTEWQTLNTAFTSSVTQSTDATDGSFSMQFAPLTSVFANAPGIVSLTYTPDNINSSTLLFDYKTQFVGADSLSVSVAIEGTDGSFGDSWFTLTNEDWTQGAINIDMNGIGTITSVIISASIGFMNADGSDLGSSTASWALLDNFHFGNAISVEENHACQPSVLLNNSGSLDLIPCEGTSNYQVKIYDTFGRLIVDQYNVQHLELGDLPSGIYLISVLKNGVVVMSDKRLL